MFELFVLDYRECYSCNINSQECKLIDGSYKCVCKSGWAGNGSYCTDINECDICNNYLCHSQAHCKNLPGTFRCTCLQGYTGDGINCEDIDECDTGKPCDQFANCTNTNGSYSCTCFNDFTGNGTHCIQIEEVTRASPHDDVTSASFLENSLLDPKSGNNL